VTHLRRDSHFLLAALTECFFSVLKVLRSPVAFIDYTHTQSIMPHSSVSVDPALLLAAESLAASCDVLEPAAARRGCYLSEQQSALRIPPVLVYLAGLAAAIVPADHDKQKQQQQRQQVFERLQLVYHRQVDSGTKDDHDAEDSESSKNHSKSKKQPQRLLVLSPTLLPAPQWQHKIAQQVQQRKSELQVQSQKLAQQLAVLQQQQQSKQKSRTRRTAAAKPTKRGPHKTQTEQHGSKENSKDDDDDDSSSSSGDEDENLVVAVAKSTEKDENRSPSFGLLDDLNNQDDDNDWTPVNRKSSSKSTAKATSKTAAPPVAVESESLTQKEEPTANEISVPVANNKNDSIVTTNVSNEDDASADPASSNAAETEYNKTATPTATATQNATTTTSDKPKVQEGQSSGSSVEQVRKLQDRVQQLETQLAAAQQQLMDERNQDDAALQAVQLRLYIAETRLQTYEDALEEHNRQVAHNVAPPSPERDTKRYSRVLQNQI